MRLKCLWRILCILLSVIVKSPFKLMRMEDWQWLGNWERGYSPKCCKRSLGYGVLLELHPSCYHTWSPASCKARDSWGRSPATPPADLFPDFPAQPARDSLQTVWGFQTTRVVVQLFVWGPLGRRLGCFPAARCKADPWEGSVWKSRHLVWC